MAVMYSISGGISWIRHRFFAPSFFMAGVIARQMVDFDRVGSATTRFVVKGFSPPFHTFHRCVEGLQVYGNVISFFHRRVSFRKKGALNKAMNSYFKKMITTLVSC